LQKKAKAANDATFSFKSYLKDDFMCFIISFLAVITLLVVWKEIAGELPGVTKWLRTISITVGYAGHHILSTYLSKANDKITGKIKDNITNSTDK
jgi:hypothetical protein